MGIVQAPMEGPMFTNMFANLTYFAFLFGISSGIVLNHNDTFLTSLGAGRRR